MKREKKKQRTFFEDFVIGVFIFTMIYSVFASCLLLKLSDEIEYLSKANKDKLVILSEKEATVREQAKMIVELEKQLEELPKWRSLGEFKITFYWVGEDEFGSMTSTGVTAKEGRTIAVDPSIIPYGSEIKIGNHVFIAEDTGSALRNGEKIIDVFVNEPRMERHYKEVFIKEKQDE